MLRVTRPGGRLVICEFGHLPAARLDAWYGRYLSAALPAVARRLSPAGDAYEYLAESIREWPPPGGTGQAHRCGGMVGDTLAEPDARGGDRARGAPPGVTMRRAARRMRRAGWPWCQGRAPGRHGQRFRLLQEALVNSFTRQSGHVRMHQHISPADSADVIVVGAGPAARQPPSTWPRPGWTCCCWRRAISRGKRCAATG